MNENLTPITISIRESINPALSNSRIKYVWRTLVELAGFPCHFVARDYQGKVDIEYGPIISDRCVLSVQQRQDFNMSTAHPTSLTREENIEFILWPGDDPLASIIFRENGKTILLNDIVLTTFYFLSGAHDNIIPRNKIGDQLVESSFLYRQQSLHIPIINKYSLLIARIFQGRPRLNLWPNKKRYAVALTHDIDYPEIYRLVETIRALAKPKPSSLHKARQIIRGKVSFWCFNQWMGIETAAGIRSAFFFSGIKNSLLSNVFSAPDPFYDVGREKYRQVLKSLMDAGFEVGLHASYNSWRSVAKFHAEKIRVENSLGQPVFSNRQHYWQSDPNAFFRTALLHHRVGLRCDTTIGFERRCGFRYAIAAPFQLLNLDSDKVIPVVELPTALMDDQLFGYRSLGYLGQPREEVDELLSQVSRNNGLFVVNFHERVLNEIMFPGWRQYYMHILAKVSDDSDCWCALPTEIADHYLRRKDELTAYFRDEAQ
jgi:uncharacterized protein DUF7033